MLELAFISTRLIKRFIYNFAVDVKECYLFSFVVYTLNFMIIVDTLRHIFSILLCFVLDLTAFLSL